MTTFHYGRVDCCSEVARLILSDSDAGIHFGNDIRVPAALMGSAAPAQLLYGSVYIFTLNPLWRASFYVIVH